jgi:hypothetical protein
MSSNTATTTIVVATLPDREVRIEREGPLYTTYVKFTYGGRDGEWDQLYHGNDGTAARTAADVYTGTTLKAMNTKTATRRIVEETEGLLASMVMQHDDISECDIDAAWFRRWLWEGIKARDPLFDAIDALTYLVRGLTVEDMTQLGPREQVLFRAIKYVETVWGINWR